MESSPRSQRTPSPPSGDFQALIRDVDSEDTRRTKESFNAFAGILRTKMQTKEPHTQTELNFMLFHLGRTTLDSINKVDHLEVKLKETEEEREKYKMWAYDQSHRMTNVEGAAVGSQAALDNIIYRQLADSALKAISDAACALFLFTDLGVPAVKEILKIVDYNGRVTHLELFPTLSKVLQMRGFSSPLPFYEQYNVMVRSANSERSQEELDNFFIRVGEDNMPGSMLTLIRSYLPFIEKARDEVRKKLGEYNVNLQKVISRCDKHRTDRDKILAEIRLENSNYTSNTDWTTIKTYKGKKGTYPSRFRDALKNPAVLKRYNCAWENRHYMDCSSKMSQAEANVANSEEKLERYENYIHSIKIGEQILSDRGITEIIVKKYYNLFRLLGNASAHPTDRVERSKEAMRRISERDDIPPEYKAAIQKLEVILDNNVPDSLRPDEFTPISNAERASVQRELGIPVTFHKPRENDDALPPDAPGTFQLQTPLWQRRYYSEEGFPRFAQVVPVAPPYTISNPAVDPADPAGVSSAAASVLSSDEDRPPVTSESGASYLDVEPGASGGSSRASQPPISA